MASDHHSGPGVAVDVVDVILELDGAQPRPSRQGLEQEFPDETAESPEPDPPPEPAETRVTPEPDPQKKPTHDCRSALLGADR